MKKHSKKHIQKLYNYIINFDKNKIFTYQNEFRSEGEQFGAIFIITNFSFTIIGDDWKELGSETYYFRNFEEFVKIFRKETLYRIPIFEIIEKLGVWRSEIE